MGGRVVEVEAMMPVSFMTQKELDRTFGCVMKQKNVIR
jgi:hypothetical protein